MRKLLEAYQKRKSKLVATNVWQISIILETKMFSMHRYISVPSFTTPRWRLVTVFCLLWAAQYHFVMSLGQSLWKKNQDWSVGLKHVRYLLQKDGQLRSELFLQLWVSSKQGIIHQNLVQRERKKNSQANVPFHIWLHCLLIRVDLNYMCFCTYYNRHK